jgi:hypothetical protein
MLIWACFLVRLFFYCATIPLWEGFDEYAHFAYVQQLATNRAIPGRNTPIPASVVDSLRLAPLPWTLKDYFATVPILHTMPGGASR